MLSWAKVPLDNRMMHLQCVDDKGNAVLDLVDPTT